MLSDTESRTIAQTTLDHLGGSQTRAMALKSVVFDTEGALHLQIASNPRFTHCKIWLENDLYSLRFMRCTLAGECMVTAQLEIEGIGCEQLRGVFEAETGLRTSFSAIYKDSDPTTGVYEREDGRFAGISRDGVRSYKTRKTAERYARG